jgi:hypothetical protein
MISKITAILSAAVVLASASVASAQTVRFGHANDPQFDPNAGTVWEDVAPY